MDIPNYLETNRAFQRTSRRKIELKEYILQASTTGINLSCRARSYLGLLGA